MFGNFHLRLAQGILEVTDAQRRLREQMQNAQPGRLAETLVDLDQLHPLTTGGGAGRVGRFAAAFLPGEAVSVFAFELEFESVAHHAASRDRILRDDAAIPFHFHLEIIVRQDGPTEVENVGEAFCIESMVEIVRHKRLEDAGLARAESAAAIDKFFHDVADLRKMEMRRDLFAMRQNETRKAVGMRAEERLKVV